MCDDILNSSANKFTEEEIVISAKHFTRRQILKSLGLLSIGGIAISGSGVSNAAIDAASADLFSPPLFMPDEGDEHIRTWMAFVASPSIWSRRQIPEVKRNLALIATTIAKYEPVSMLVAPHDYDEAVTLLGGLNAHNYSIELIQCELDDFWLRDTGPTFVKGSNGDKYGIDFNFNGWGGKQTHKHDAKVARFITQASGALAKTTSVVLEGGCFEVDGVGTAIMTKSCILNNNRNPHLSQADMENELCALLGLRKIIWLDGIKGKDITDGHTDFYARFSRKGEVVVSRDNYQSSFDYAVTRKNIEVLSQSTDANGKPLSLVIIDTPDTINEQFGVNDFAAGYIGYYMCNGAIISQKFGDKRADDKAKAILSQTFPDRVIEQIAIDGIASGGGSIHCATQQEIK